MRGDSNPFSPDVNTLRIGEGRVRVAATRSVHAAHVLRGGLAAPSCVYLLADGRAVAWFDEGRPFVVHSDLDALHAMHGTSDGALRVAA
jgi:hypothetical protein